MMKRLLIMMVVMLLVTTSLLARPGYTKPVDVLQPDGTMVTLLMHGDEFFSYMTTVDGYTVVKGDDGFYRYAEKQNGELKATTFIAKNADLRTAPEQAFLAGMKKGLHANVSETSKEMRAMAAKMYSPRYATMGNARRAITPGAISERIDYNNFKGLVILVNWNDKAFQINNPQEFYQKLTSQKNFTDDSKAVYPFNVKGSARDYFFDNSMGIFDPTFDVVGPVTINYSCTYPEPKDLNGNVNPWYMTRMINILKAVMDKVNPTVDFSKYDLNNDGFIDMVYLVFAGYGSYVQGNSNKYLWPHANDFSAKAYTSGTTTYADYYGMTGYDGKKFGRYACSVEIQDYEALAAQHSYPDGIGTICHEFSHVLGLADHYDTDYDDNGVGVTPGEYDIMDAGADHNQGLCPVGYNSFERKILGFGDNSIKTLEAGDYQLEPFNTSNVAYIVNTAKNGEVFYVENRQRTGWDECIPGAGLLVWRADTSNPQKFISNTVNNKPGEECFQILGKAPISSLDLTSENNEVWNKKGAVIDLYDITNANGVISFTAGTDVYPILVEDFENTPLADVNTSGLSGKLSTWNIDNAKIVASQPGYGNGMRMVEFSSLGKLTSAALSKNIRTLKFTIVNGGKKTKFALRTSTDGNTWSVMKTTSGATSVDISKNSSRTLTYQNIPAGTIIQFMAGSDTEKCYLDDIEYSYAKGATGINDMRTTRKVVSGESYNLAGQRVDVGYKGLVIKNGKKVLMK